MNTSMSYVLGFSTALVAAVIGQIVSHLLTNRRARRQEVKQRFEKLYYPVLDDVIYYVQLHVIPYHGNVKKSFKDNKDATFHKVLSHIDQNRLYAGKVVLREAMTVSKYKLIDDMSGIHEPAHRLQLLLAFMMEASDVMRKLGIPVTKEVAECEVLLGVWVLAKKLLSYETYDTPSFWVYEYIQSPPRRKVRVFSRLVLSQDFYYNRPFPRGVFKKARRARLVSLLRAFASEHNKRNIKLVQVLKNVPISDE